MDCDLLVTHLGECLGGWLHEPRTDPPPLWIYVLSDIWAFHLCPTGGGGGDAYSIFISAILAAQVDP